MAGLSDEEIDAIAAAVGKHLQDHPVCRMFDMDEVAFLKRSHKLAARAGNVALATIVGFLVLGALSAFLGGLIGKLGFKVMQ